MNYTGRLIIKTGGFSLDEGILIIDTEILAWDTLRLIMYTGKTGMDTGILGTDTERLEIYLGILGMDTVDW